MSQQKTIACFWYRDEATYIRFREIIDDKPQLASAYSEWRIRTEEGIQAFKKQGVIVVKIDADPDEFLQWCHVNSHAPNSAARQRFAGEKLHRKIKDG